MVPDNYGYYASLPPIGFLFGSFLSNRLTHRLGVDNLIAIGSAVLIPTGCVMVALASLHAVSPYTIVGPMILICCGSGLITPNAIAGSLGVDIGIVGASSGLVSFIQMSGAAGATAALSLGATGNPVVLAAVIASAGLFAAASFGALTRSSRLPQQRMRRFGLGVIRASDCGGSSRATNPSPRVRPTDTVCGARSVRAATIVAGRSK
jgi:DHA1 family bicyclomycin/chloramphenicol resistance-like MFS transporter